VSHWKPLGFRIECVLRHELTGRLNNLKLLARILVPEVRGTCGVSVDLSLSVYKHASVRFEVPTAVLRKIAR